MNGPRLALEQSLRYKGRSGHWAWLLHRVTGLGTALFLTVHILDTATVYFAPDVYRWFVELYKTPLFGLGEIGLVACVILHAANGARVAAVDLRPEWSGQQRQLSYIVYAVFFALFIPAGGLMLWRIIERLGGA